MPEDTCYKGESYQKWSNAVSKVNDSFLNLFPKILEKGSHQNYNKANPNYPKIEGCDKSKVAACIDAYNFIHAESENKNIDLEKASNIEQKALEIFESTRELMKIIELRDKATKLHDRIIDEFEEVQASEYNFEVQRIILEYHGSDKKSKDKLKNKILHRTDAYQKAKANIEKYLKEFQSSSKSLATKEGLPFDKNFNKNQYLNYLQFLENFEINGKCIKDYFKDQNDEWLHSLKQITPQGSSEVLEPTEQKCRESEEKQNKFKHKLKMFREICQDAESSLNSATLEELQANYKEITDVQRELKEMCYDADIEVSDDWKKYIKEAKQLPREITKKITNIQTQKAIESEKRRQEANANIRSLEAIKLLPLTGSGDFIAWKKNQKCLNTHPDPYKKAAALLATLKNPQDRKMCENIDDFDKQMTILNEKYNHSEKIVPEMKRELDKLPIAQTDGAMLHNIRTILNVYERMKEIGAKECFDGSVVANLMKKLPNIKKDFERYKIREKRSEYLQANNSLNYDEDGHNLTLQSSSKDNMDLNIIDNSPEHRQLFLQFIREELIVLDYTSEESKLKDDGKQKCPKCKQNTKYCKCEKPKIKAGLYPLEVANACICCGSKEPHKTKYGKVTSSLGRCPKFQNMTLESKRDFANKNKACYVCLVPGHSKNECRIQNDCLKCKKGKHHISLCKEAEIPNQVKSEVQTYEVNAYEGEVHLDFEEEQGINVLREVTEGKILFVDPITGKFHENNYRDINILWDTGAMINLIENNLPRELGYKGNLSELEIQTVTSTSTTPRQYMYKVYIIDRDGNVWEIKAFGHPHNIMPKDSRPLNEKALRKYAKQFKVRKNQIQNNDGPIHLIIGNSTLRPLFPSQKGWTGFQEIGAPYLKSEGLGIYKTKFGDKPFFLSGTVSAKDFLEPSSPSRACMHHMEVYTDNYWTGDQLGLNLDPKCSTCIKAPPCKPCKLLTQPVTYKEQEEGKVIRASMKFDQVNKQVSVNYPYNRNIDKIFAPEKSNKSTAEKMAYNLKKSLKRDGLLEFYTDNFIDMETRGAIKELTEEEMQLWESQGNPVNYCSHHAVEKDSKTTPCRSVCNSSLSHNGTSLNELLPKGPKAISNLLHVLIRFRAKPHIVIADLKKAYNTIKTSEKDMHLRRLMWFRPEDLENPDAKLKTFGMLTMAFGDIPAQFYLECAKQEVSVYIREIMKDPVLADAIISMSYVDDLVIAVETAQEAKDFATKLPIGFESYGFKIKEIFVGGRGVKQATDHDNQLLLGHYYNPNTDEMIMKFSVNFSAKKRSQKIEPNLNKSSDLTGLEMTKRKALSLLSSQYDPLGLASVFLAKFKIFLAELFKNTEYKNKWDMPLNDEQQKKALKLVKEMIMAADNPPVFPRSNKPEGFTISKLVVFVDASTIALQVVVYGLYTSEEKIHTSLISAKARIANNTVPRNELQSLVAGHRLALNILTALDETVLEVCFLSDSTCTLDSIQDEYKSKDIYIINRVSEIRKSAQKMNCEVKYYHIPTELNIADKGTREDCTLEYLSSDEWQHGPEFIKDLESCATLKKSINEDDKPPKTFPCMDVNCMMIKGTQSKMNVMDDLLKRSNNLKTVLRAICIVKTILKRKSFKGKTSLIKSDMQNAMMMLIKHTQETSNMESMRTKQLVTYKENGVIYTKMRFPEEVMNTVFGKDQLPVLPGKSDLAKLILINAHQEKIAMNMNTLHNGIHQTLVNSRIGVYGCYITYAKHVIKGIIKSCPVCRRQSKLTSDAKMAERQGGFGEIPPDGSCFNKLAIDYFGPFWSKPPKSRETRGTKFYKMYGMAVLCQQTRALRFYPVEGYDTKSFLTTFEIHCAMHGVPTHVLSDPMSAFISGAKVVGTETTDYQPGDESEFENVLKRKYNIVWDFIPPGSQWRDPAERSVKSLKGMMQTIFNTEHNKIVLTINEYWSIFSQCAEILNRRPIQGYMDDSTLKFICPNQLLLGKTAKESPPYTNEDLETRPRLELLQTIKKEFWKHLMNVLAADSRLMKYPCWYSQTREPKPGDVVLVLYKSKVSDNYRMGLIESVNKNKRDITCYVSPCQDGTLNHFKSGATMDIPIQRTILLYSPND